MRVMRNGYALEVEDGGVDHPPLLLLHGFPMSSEIFAPVRPVVERAGRLVTVDLKGFGRSDAPEGGYGMDALAEDVVAVADQLGLDRFALGGHSMGGYVAFRVAEAHRDRLAGLVLIGTHPASDSVEATEVRRSAIATIERGDRDRYLEESLPRVVGDTARARVPELLDRIRAMAATVPDHVLTGCLEGMIERPDSRGLLPELDVPALVVVGAEDAMISVGQAQAMADALPQGRLKVIPEAGHTPTLESPVATGDALAVFLRGLS